jgi:ankyrin repeat protein
MTEAAQALWQVIVLGDTPRTLSLIRGNPTLLSSRLPGNATPLMHAAYRRDAALAEGLIELGAKVDFITAVILGRTAMVGEMLERDLRLIRKRSPNGWSALHLAAAYGDAEMVRLLLSLGADPNDAPAKIGCTPLFWASSPPFEKAELLLAHGADINYRGKHGLTVLHSAAASGEEDWLEFLLAHGADAQLQTDARQTPWAIAVRYKKDRIAQKLTEAACSREKLRRLR